MTESGDRSGPASRRTDPPSGTRTGRAPAESSDPERDAVDRADYDPDYDPSAPVTCEVCGGTMFYTAACKLKCPRCGYTRDCSDP